METNKGILNCGTRVLTTTPLPGKEKEWALKTRKNRRWGCPGIIVMYHDSHGLYYDVKHDDGGPIASYDPREFIVSVKPADRDYYGGKDNPYECIKVIENWNLGFNLGTAVKYISRLDKKPGVDGVEDLEKAVWYLEREIVRRKDDKKTGEVGAQEESPPDSGDTDGE